MQEVASPSQGSTQLLSQIYIYYQISSSHVLSISYLWTQLKKWKLKENWKERVQADQRTNNEKWLK